MMGAEEHNLTQTHGDLPLNAAWFCVSVVADPL